MANSSFLQSNKALKLIDAGDGTFHQSVVISGDGITIENVDISGLDNIENIGTIKTVSVVEEVVKVGTLLDGTISISNESIPVTGTVSVEGVTVEDINTVSTIETILDGTLSKVEEVVKVGTLLNGTVSVTNQTIASAPSHLTFSVTSVSTTISSTSATRKYLCIANNTDTDVWVSFGTVSVVTKGIPLFKNGSAYEMSAGLGNLYTGDVTAILSGTVSKIVQVVEG